tara:strand:+ start:13529 stop:14224 length:696 start_codon:yes stop_codon:yes gene_type:complete
MNTPEKNTIYNEDCLETMRRMPDNSVDFILTSPPYNRKRNDKYADYDDNVDNYYEWLVEIIDECLRVTKNNVFFNIQKTMYNKKDVYNLMHHFADDLYDVIVWEKSNPNPSNGHNVTNAYEFILVFGSSFKANKTYVKNHFRTSVTQGFDEHKAVMHSKAAQFIILNFTNEGDFIYDPFNGTGTTSLVCAINNRFYCGSEISEKYFQLSEERMQKEMGMFFAQMTLLTPKP